MKAETIQKLVNDSIKNGVMDVGTIVGMAIEQEKKIKSKLLVIQNIKNDYMDEVKRQLEELNKQVREVQQDCPHIETVYEGDPSGNNDSYTYCAWCGKEV